MIRFGRSSVSSTGYDGFHDISILGGTLDGNAEKTSILRFAHASRITLQGIHFTNVTKAHHMEFAASKQVTIDGCTFDGFAPQNATGSTNYEAVQIDILQEDHFPNYGVYDGTPTSDVTITDNTFCGVNRGVGCHSGEIGRYFTNIHISNNTFRDITGYAIIATNFKNATISDNVITNAGAGIFFRHITPDYGNYYPGDTSGVSADMNSSITGNRITLTDTGFTNTAYGISLYGERLTSDQKKSYSDSSTGETVTVTIPAGDYRVKGVTLSGNTITLQSAAYGIWLRGVCSGTVKKNTIQYTGTVPDGASDGIRVQNNSDTILETNCIKYASKNGIYLTCSTGCTLRSNEIKTVGKHGIYAEQSTVETIAKNQISNCNNHGILVNKDSTVKTITKNTLKTIKNHGIYANQKTNASSITKNKITDAKGNGIYINTTKPKITVSGNALTSCHTIGIDLGKGVKGTVAANSFSKTKAQLRVQSLSSAKINTQNFKIEKASTSSGKVTLHFKKAGGAKLYTVYRSDSKNGTYQKIGTTKTTKFTDKKAKKGKTRFYKIAPTFQSGKLTAESALSAAKSVKVK